MQELPRFRFCHFKTIEGGVVLSTGIPGLDNLLGGGIPEGHVVAVIGSYGTGKRR